MLCTEPSPGALRSLVDIVDAALWGDDSAPGGAELLRVVVDPHAGAEPDVDDDPEADDDLDGAEPGRIGEAEGVGLGFLPLHGGHPLDALLGMVAPAHWYALGVTAPGDAQLLGGHDGDDSDVDDGDDDSGDDDVDGDGEGPFEPVHVTMLLTRSGDAAGVLRRAGRPPTRLDGPPQGQVADACRRALGLPTAAPPGGTAGLWVRWWLDRLVQAGSRRDTSGVVLGWAEAVAHHPATFVPAPGSGRPPLARAAPAPELAAVVAATTALADGWTWGRLRSEHRVADLPGPPLTGRVAGWMDDGMFARWQLSALPPLADLLDACRALLPESVAARVWAAALAGLDQRAGQPPGQRPDQPSDQPRADR